MSSKSQSVSEEELNSLKEAFAIYDTNKNGAIDVGEFASILKSLNVETSDQKVKEIINNLDKNRDGKIDFNEFVTAMTIIMSQPEAFTSEPESILPEDSKASATRREVKKGYSRRLSSTHSVDDLKTCFKKFDTNGDGLISTEELLEVMKGLGENLSEEEIKDMMNDGDSNKDGFIDFDEFKALLPVLGDK